MAKKLTNAYMHKAPKGKAKVAPYPQTLKQKFGGKKKAVKGAAYKAAPKKAAKTKKVGRRISQHKRLAMGEKI